MNYFDMCASVKHFLIVALLGVIFESTLQTALPDRVFTFNDTSINNKTIADLVQRQTDTIKKLVSTHNRPPDYPILKRYPPEQKTTDNIPLEDLKIKCEHLAHLATSTTTSTTTTPPPSINSPKSGFYITTERPVPTIPPPKSTTTPPYKYIKLEPVILQKTIMSDGRTVYYWHKSIPSQFPVSAPPPTTPPTTTPASGYSLRNFFPSFYSIGGAEPADATTTEKTPAPDRPDELLYQQQLKFVVPVPYAPVDDSPYRKPWEFDQYAYYPKPLQPESVNVQMPYVPTFHVIKALAVPNQFEGANERI